MARTIVILLLVGLIIAVGLYVGTRQSTPSSPSPPAQDFKGVGLVVKYDSQACSQQIYGKYPYFSVCFNRGSIPLSYVSRMHASIFQAGAGSSEGDVLCNGGNGVPIGPVYICAMNLALPDMIQFGQIQVQANWYDSSGNSSPVQTVYINTNADYGGSCC